MVKLNAANRLTASAAKPGAVTPEIVDQLEGLLKKTNSPSGDAKNKAWSAIQKILINDLGADKGKVAGNRDMLKFIDKKLGTKHTKEFDDDTVMPLTISQQKKLKKG